MKRKIDVWDYAGTIMKAVETGALVTVKANGKVNSMSIGWGALGIEWNTPLFIAYIRESRFTRELLDQNPEFTVNIPLGECDPYILNLCGTRSGRDTDKIAELGLTTVEGETVSVSAIKELPLTLECRLIYRQLQDVPAVAEQLRAIHYPEPYDIHVAYYGEITAAYILE
ncbi:MAG: flavin reductase family protein [Oscillospiraceae bacterium]|nr:flavin reductase family protein [Oscillospiraceae bacterium]